MSTETWACRFHRKRDEGQHNRGDRCDYCDRLRSQCERKGTAAKPRIKPSADAIVEVFRRAAPDRVVPYAEAVRLVREAFRTTGTNASDWLDEVLLDSRDLWLTYVREYGNVGGLTVRNEGRWPTLKSERVISGIGEKGVTDDLFPEGRGSGIFSLYVDRDGRYASEQCKRTGFMPENGLPHVVLTSTLQGMLRQATEHEAGEAAVRGAEGVLERAAWDAEHGAAMDYLRGFLDDAGILQSGAGSRVSPHADGGRTSLTMSLVGSDIDRFAAALQALGVQPKRKPGAA